MTKHTYFRADDGTLFIPEPMDGSFVVHFCTNNAIAYDACIKHDSETSPHIILSRRITDCGFTVRVLNIMKSIDVRIVQDLCNYRKADVLQRRNVSPKSFAEIDDFMTSHNLKWKEV